MQEDDSEDHDHRELEQTAHNHHQHHHHHYHRHNGAAVVKEKAAVEILSEREQEPHVAGAAAADGRLVAAERKSAVAANQVEPAQKQPPDNRARDDTQQADDADSAPAEAQEAASRHQDAGPNILDISYSAPTVSPPSPESAAAKQGHALTQDGADLAKEDAPGSSSQHTDVVGAPEHKEEHAEQVAQPQGGLAEALWHSRCVCVCVFEYVCSDVKESV